MGTLTQGDNGNFSVMTAYGVADSTNVISGDLYTSIHNTNVHWCTWMTSNFRVPHRVEKHVGVSSVKSST